MVEFSQGLSKCHRSVAVISEVKVVAGGCGGVAYPPQGWRLKDLVPLETSSQPIEEQPEELGGRCG